MSPSQRQIYRRRRITVFGGLILLLAMGFYLPLTLLAPLSPAVAEVQPWSAPATAPATLTFPGYGAVGIGAVGFPGVLASSGTANQLPIASLTKVVTALTVLDAKPLALGATGPDITFTDADMGFYDDLVAQDGVVAPVVPGQVISERNILDVMLMASAGNYADSVAVWAFGSEPAFLDAVKVWLAKAGLANTTITDPTGILASNTSSVADLLQLGKLALSNPVVAQIVSTVSLDVPGVGAVANRNELLGVDGVDGIKTGTLDESGACLLFSAKKNVGDHTIEIVGVALGGPDHPTVNADMHALLDQVTAGFHSVELVAKGDDFANYDTPWGDTASAVAAKTASVVVWSTTPMSVAVHADPLGTSRANSPAGSVVFTVGDKTITVPLEVAGRIADPGPWWRLTNPSKLF
ncbi:MAG: D-alanyl-D-alanine carboxypeptidase [Rhodoglobus sp.]